MTRVQAELPFAVAPEQLRIPTWEEFTHAARYFRADYHIVGAQERHFPGLFHPRNPFGRYSVTNIHEQLTEREFLLQLKGTNVLAIGCMDMHTAAPFEKKVRERYAPANPADPPPKIAMLTLAGGGIQLLPERKQHFTTLMSYLGFHLSMGKEPHSKLDVIVSAHDNGCGLIKNAVGKGTHLYELWQLPGGSPIERSAVKALLLQEIIANNLPRYFNSTSTRIIPVLCAIDRTNEENLQLDDNFWGVDQNSILS